MFIMKKLLFILTALAAIAAGCYSDYSEGERAGQVVKFSKKGKIYKTYEGEISLGGVVPNAEGVLTPNVFCFSLDAEQKRGENIQALADSIRKAMELGVRVKVHYHQEINTDWNSSRGETGHYVDKVTLLY